MPPLPPPPTPRLVVYHQTHHHDSAGEKPISALPLITQPGISLTHIIVAAIHINEDPAKLTLNDHHPSHPRFQTLWAEMRVLQAAGVKVLGMLGGAAKGSYQRLDGDDGQFERFYGPVRDLVRERALDGLDLDVEEDMSLGGAIRLIDRLRADFGAGFLVTLAPVAAALLDASRNLSGFDYEALEVMRGRDIAWYNAQFYNGWGDCGSTVMVDMMVQRGWPADKLVVGLITSPANGNGYVPFEALGGVLAALRERYPSFGGVMGWEFFNSLPGGRERPWEWAREMTKLLGRLNAPPTTQPVPPSAPAKEDEPAAALAEADPDGPGGSHPAVPAEFEYFTDASDD